MYVIEKKGRFFVRTSLDGGYSKSLNRARLYDTKADAIRWCGPGERVFEVKLTLGKQVK